MKFYKYYILLLLFLLIKPVFGKAASLPADTLKYTGKFKNLGVQVAEKWLEGSVFTEDDDGNEWVYTVLRGKPGYLLGYNLTKSSLQVNLPLERWMVPGTLQCLLMVGFILQDLQVGDWLNTVQEVRK